MSRIGKMPIEIASGVNVTLSGRNITVKGVKATLSAELPADVNVEIKNNTIVFNPANDTQAAGAFWGLARNLVNNMMIGVSKGFTINLEINGVGYRAAIEGKKLVMALGYSHPIEIEIPDGIEIKCAKPTEISISGVDKQKVGQIAAVIRSYRKPEPYKGKGIKYSTETIRRKEGKKK